MPESAADHEQVRTQIAREISDVHLESYGQPVEDVVVELGERFVAVVMDIVLLVESNSLSSSSAR